jgi:diguanylate cyclase (GGDEF)-like protein
VAARIRQRLTEPLEAAGRPVCIDVSIGLAVTASRTDHPEQLIQQADLALYRAKNNGRGRIERFTGDQPASPRPLSSTGT